MPVFPIFLNTRTYTLGVLGVRRPVTRRGAQGCFLPPRKFFASPGKIFWFPQLWQKGRFSLLYLTLSSRLGSLLLRWKAADTVFIVVSFKFQVWRYSPAVAISLVSTPSTACQSPSACMIARSSAYAYFLETVRWLAGQRCRYWREGAPGQIPVGRRSWGVVTCFFCRFRWWGWSCDCHPSPSGP